MKLLYCLIGVFILIPVSVLAQEQITITTYYPSPYGSYRDLEVSNNLRVRGTTPADAAIYATNTVPTATAPDKYAVYGTTGDGAVRGALGRAWNNQRYAVYGYAQQVANRYAGYFDGNVYIRGTLSGPNLGSQCVNYNINNPVTTTCPAGYYVVACGTGDCTNLGILASPTGCPQSGYMICLRR